MSQSSAVNLTNDWALPFTGGGALCTRTLPGSVKSIRLWCIPCILSNTLSCIRVLHSLHHSQKLGVSSPVSAKYSSGGNRVDNASRCPSCRINPYAGLIKNVLKPFRTWACPEKTPESLYMTRTSPNFFAAGVLLAVWKIQGQML